MADPVELTVVQVRTDDRWRAVAVIDGRRYPDKETYERVVWDAFATMNAQDDLPSQFESRDVSPTEPPSPLPSWEDYRATLAPKGAGDTA
jgi:hypothetical protein